MAGGGSAEFLNAAAVYLGAAVVSVPVFKRLKLGSVLGYLAAGVVIGPHVLALIPDGDATMRLGEFGVVLLLFVIGLELNPSRLWRLRADIFGLGAAQVMITGALIALISGSIGVFGYNLDWREAVLAGAALALSSTAFAVQILREKGDLATPYGDRAFAILLFQDLAIVPLLAMVSLLAPAAAAGGGESGWLVGAKMLGALIAVYLIGRYAMRPVFQIIAQTKADEVFTAAALLVVIGSALLMDAAGLSMAMGAFLAGVLLAESEFRHQLETDIEPFRGLLMGLFFIAVGLSLDVSLLLTQIHWILLGVAALLALKMAILYVLARTAGSGRSDAVRIAAVLCQGGEFGFVLVTVGVSVGALGGANAAFLTATIILSMAATPVVVAVAERFTLRRGDDVMDGVARMEDAEEHAKAPIIVAGFGRFGQVVARILRLRGYEVTLIDYNATRIRFAETFGNTVFFGDARRLDILAKAGAAGARAIFLCIDDRDGARLAVERIKNRFPNTTIYASTYDRFSMLEMEKAGAHFVERESFEAAIALASKALVEFGDGDAVEDLIAEFRRRDARLLRLQAEYGAYEGLRKLREEFTLEQER